MLPIADRERFQRDGFLHVRGCLSGADLTELRAAIDDLLAGPRNDDFLIADDTKSLRKIAYVFDKHPAFLVALAHPNLLGLAASLSRSPEELVVTWEDLLVKEARVGCSVAVHQDLALQCVRGGVFSLGVHLDDALENPVWFLPGSHLRGPLARDDVRRLHAERRDAFVPVAPRAGDIVVHDVLTVHFSEANLAPHPRHTWYLEFRTVSELEKDGPWDREWIARRQALLLLALEARRKRSLPVPDLALSGRELLGPYLDPPRLRIPHVGNGVQYDTTSSFYHFD